MRTVTNIQSNGFGLYIIAHFCTKHLDHVDGGDDDGSDVNDQGHSTERVVMNNKEHELSELSAQATHEDKLLPGQHEM